MADEESSALQSTPRSIRCRYCGQRNQFREQESIEARCGRCRLLLSEEPHKKFAARKGNYYRVQGPVRERVEARPTILWLKDYNGDGKALEFALFEAEACMGLQTTLIGYSEKQDRVVQYPISLEVIEGSNHSTRTTSWADYLFSKKPLRTGYWKYEIDYRGRAGSLDKWEVRYDAARERFEGKLIIVAGD